MILQFLTVMKTNIRVKQAIQIRTLSAGVIISHLKQKLKFSATAKRLFLQKFVVFIRKLKQTEIFPVTYR